MTNAKREPRRDIGRNDRPVAIMTGASYGIGAACSEALAREGFDIVATEIDAAELEALARSVEAHGAEIEAVALDLRDAPSIRETVHSALRRFGRADVLVNNAGRPLMKPALEVGYDEFMDIMAVNVAGSYFMAQEMARHLVNAGKPGSIINLASTHAIIGGTNVSAYGVSKTAIAGLTRHLSIEWAKHGIRVNAVAPGAAETKLRKAAFDANPSFREAHVNQIPMKRLCTPEDVAEAVVYLAGPGSSYVTGQVIVVDGGLTRS